MRKTRCPIVTRDVFADEFANLNIVKPFLSDMTMNVLGWSISFIL